MFFSSLFFLLRNRVITHIFFFGSTLSNATRYPQLMRQIFFSFSSAQAVIKELRRESASTRVSGHTYINLQREFWAGKLTAEFRSHVLTVLDHISLRTTVE
jgi:hypothetical protein